MHEYPITERIVQIAADKCKDAGGSRVDTIKLIVGDYSGYVGESIRIYFDIIAEGTVCEGAVLDIARIKPKLRCTKCGHLFEKPHMSFACPRCGGDGGPTDIGKEFYVESIEIE